MKRKPDPLAHLQQQFLAQLPALWPPLKGSLALVKKPCIRKNCPACARGDKHPAWLFSCTQDGRRRCLYVPKGWSRSCARASKTAAGSSNFAGRSVRI